EKAVVLAADRAGVLDTGAGCMTFDSPQSKIQILRSGVAIGIAGEGMEGHVVVSQVGGRKLADIPAWLHDQRKARRASFVERLRQADSRMHGMLNRVVDDTDVHRWLEWGFIKDKWALEFLIAGVDETGAHLWVVAERDGAEQPTACDIGGFAAI